MKLSVLAFVLVFSCALHAQDKQTSESSAVATASPKNHGKTGILASQAATAGGFFDGFDVPGNRLDTSRWTTEFGDASFLGRTRLRDWVSASSTGTFVVSDGSAQLALDTFNPTEPDHFYGSHAKTLMTFQATQTTDFVLSVRMRLGSLRGGIVYGIYFYDCEPVVCPGSHDELDIEVVTNYLQPGASPLRVQLNRYAAEPLDAGHGPIVNLPGGFDPLAFHEWKIRWGLSQVTYYVDDLELSSAITFIPQGPMHANMIAWGPTSDWPDAFDASLKPTSSEGNQHLVAQIDYVSVVSIASGAATPVNTPRRRAVQPP